jgi:hypothetical protein
MSNIRNGGRGGHLVAIIRRMLIERIDRVIRAFEERAVGVRVLHLRRRRTFLIFQNAAEFSSMTIGLMLKHGA